jgi:hypothetical protein
VNCVAEIEFDVFISESKNYNIFLVGGGGGGSEIIFGLFSFLQMA